jgi:hypothetical protein
VPIFISHSFEDKSLFEGFQKELKASGITIWDPQSMELGMSLATQLRVAIEQCDLCVFIATKDSLNSQWCLAELGAFWGANKKVIIYLADRTVSETQIPKQFQGNYWTDDPFKVRDSVRSAYEAARPTPRLIPSTLKEACCKIIVNINNEEIKGTGYLIGPKLVATAAHIARNPATDTFMLKFISGRQVIAQLMARDERVDAMVLQLETPIEDTQPLQLVEHCEVGSLCRGFGFSQLTHESGVPFVCEVVDERGMDDKGIGSLVIHSSILASGGLEGIQGLSGSPIWLNGAVVGHLRRMILNREADMPAFGLFFATPASEILRLQQLKSSE